MARKETSSQVVNGSPSSSTEANVSPLNFFQFFSFARLRCPNRGKYIVGFFLLSTGSNQLFSCLSFCRFTVLVWKVRFLSVDVRLYLNANLVLNFLLKLSAQIFSLSNLVWSTDLRIWLSTEWFDEERELGIQFPPIYLMLQLLSWEPYRRSQGTVAVIRVSTFPRQRPALRGTRHTQRGMRSPKQQKGWRWSIQE